MADGGFMLTAVLQLNKEKVDLENRLEVEQEYIVNKLRKQVRLGSCQLLFKLICSLCRHLQG
jgi:hypothetical protein